MTFGCDFWLEMGIGIEDWNWGMELVIGIGDWDWGIGIGVWD